MNILNVEVHTIVHAVDTYMNYVVEVILGEERAKNL